MNTKLIDCMTRLLKFEEKKKQWERDARLWDEKQKAFETNKVELEKELKELKERDKGKQVQVISSSIQSGTDSLSQAISQVSLKVL